MKIIELELEEGDKILMVDMSEEIHLRTFNTTAQKLAEAAEQQKTKKTFEETVPSYYHSYRDIFSKELFDELPPQRSWDHAIKLLPGTDGFDRKIYPLSSDEQKELNKFLDEHLKTGRIRPSKSPIASPFFFIKKKDRSLQPVQDY